MKKLILMVVMLFCMISVAIAAMPTDYIVLPNTGNIRVDLLQTPDAEKYEEWGVWAYSFIEINTVVTPTDVLPLFDFMETQNIVDLTYDGTTLTNNMYSIDLHNDSIGIVFMYNIEGVGPEDTTWTSHVSLNTDGIDYFGIDGNDSIVYAAWVGGDGMVGMIGVNAATSAVPIPGAAWLLGSGIIGMVAVRKRNR